MYSFYFTNLLHKNNYNVTISFYISTNLYYNVNLAYVSELIKYMSK